MKYYLIVDEIGNVISKYETSNINAQFSDRIEVTQEVYNSVEVFTYYYQYKDGELINLGPKPMEDM